jgi:hypothetical protein
MRESDRSIDNYKTYTTNIGRVVLAMKLFINGSDAHIYENIYENIYERVRINMAAFYSYVVQDPRNHPEVFQYIQECRDAINFVNYGSFKVMGNNNGIQLVYLEQKHNSESNKYFASENIYTFHKKTMSIGFQLPTF